MPGTCSACLLPSDAFSLTFYTCRYLAEKTSCVRQSYHVIMYSSRLESSCWEQADLATGTETLAGQVKARS